jgi:outer membrane receptor protein involved in Fe transport
MKQNNAVAAFRRTAISLAVGMCLSGAVYAQSADGNILGKAKGGSTVTLTAPGGKTTTMTAGPDGSFSFPRLQAGTYRVAADGITRDVVVAAGVDSRVALDSPAAAAAGERITVTGSRILRDTFNSASPVQVITRDETLMSGFASTTAALQSTAATAGSSQINNAFGGFVTDGGPGANTIALRGLSATRTLVLLNGRRVAPAGTRGAVGSADLNVLPSAIIDRIEILKDGASSIYGSDAVAGVVNIITKKNVQGVTLEAQHNAPEHGGGEETRVSATLGLTTDRGFFTASLEQYDRNAILWGDRDWMKCQTQYRRTVTGGVPGEWGSSDFIDPVTGQPKCYTTGLTGEDGVTINTIGTGSLTGVAAPGAVGTSFNRWRPNSAITSGLVGFEGVGGGANSLFPRDTFDPNMMKQTLISPVTVRTGFLQGAYDLHALGNAELYGEALFSSRKSQQVGFRQLTMDYTRGSPLIPEGLRNVPNLQAAGTLIAPGPVQVRGFISGGNYNSDQDVDYTKILGGLRGNMPFRDWQYDLTATYAKSDASYAFDVFLTDRVAQSLDVVAGPNGGFVCRDPSNGCVAAPALTTAFIGGQLPKPWMDYVYTTEVGNTKYEETTVTLNTNGTLFQMPHGAARGAVGVEYRRAEIDDTPGPNMQASNLYNFTTASPTRGSDNVWELYGEVEVPLLRGVPGAEELTVNASGRYTDYKSYGSDDTYKIGLLYTPVKAVSFRASQGTSYRAPALFEQFLGSTTGFQAAANDPCNNYATSAAPTRAANCASEGLPGNFQQTSSIQVNAVGGAEAGLKAETSKNKSFGVIFQPTLPTGAGDVSFAIDYFDIKIDNGVARAGFGSILQLCYDDPDFRAGGGFCNLVTRGTAASPTSLVVNDSYVNLSSDIVKGYDFTLRYVRNIGEGQFRFNGILTKYEEQSNRLFPDDPLTVNTGSLRYPEITGAADFTYTWKSWRVRYGFEYLGKMDSYELVEEDPETSTFLFKTDKYVTHNASVEYKGDKWSIIAGVRNFTDETPPPISAGAYNRRGNTLLYSGFDYFGRTYFINGQFSF